MKQSSIDAIAARRELVSRVARIKNRDKRGVIGGAGAIRGSVLVDQVQQMGGGPPSTASPHVTRWTGE